MCSLKRLKTCSRGPERVRGVSGLLGLNFKLLISFASHVLSELLTFCSVDDVDGVCFVLSLAVV